MNLYLYKFSKKANSTKVPDQEQLVLPNIKLKEDTSKQTPTFILNAGLLGVDTGYNYAWYNGTWYFIEDYTLRNNNIYEISCVKDVLGTYANQIKASSQYVLRSASESDDDIIDSWYLTRGRITSIVKTSAQVYSNNLAYIVGFIGKRDSLTVEGFTIYNEPLGSVKYFYMTQAQMNLLIGFLMSDVSTSTFYNISQDAMDLQVQKALFNPLQYIVSCKAVPENIPFLRQSRAFNISFGWNYELPSTITGYPIDPSANLFDVYPSISFDIDVPKHPLADTRGAYLNLAPFSQYILNLEPFGDIPLDTLKLNDAEKLRCNIQVDPVSGDGFLNIATIGSGGTIRTPHVYYGRSRIMANIQLTQIANNYMAEKRAEVGLFSSSIGAIASGASGNIGGIASGMASVANSILDAQSASFPLVEKEGCADSVFIVGRNASLFAQFASIVDEDNAQFGRPLCRVKKLDDLTGFTVCKNASISLPAPRSDIDAVINYLNTGVYIE